MTLWWTTLGEAPPLLMAVTETVLGCPDIAQQMRRGMDEVNRRLPAAALGAEQAREAQTGQMKGGGDRLGNGDHGYDHPYADGSCFVFHDHKMAVRGPDFQLKLNAGA
jgi:hypothetical protein